MAYKQAEDDFVVGLRNAHALEHQALAVMKRQVERIESYPQVAERLRQHIQETNQQLRRLDEILARLGETSSSLKDTGMNVLGNLMAVGHAAAQDEILKNSFANFALENYEIAAYKSLCKMAELTGHSDALPPLQATLNEEIAMAKWLDDHMESVTAAYIGREKAGVRSGI